MSDWIEWKGGECPVAMDVRVQYMLRDGMTFTDPAAALDWEHKPYLMPEADIVRYRLAAPLETGATADCCGGNCLMRCPPAAPAATPTFSGDICLCGERMVRADIAESEIADLRGKLEQAQKDAESKQAKIDALMLEFCPDEMPAEQTANWAAHQVPASPEENAAIDAALKEASNG